MTLIVIAIDGPAGSGKSTAARRLALELSYMYLNTGAMYRAAALLAQEGGFDLSDEKKIAGIARAMRFEYIESGGKQRFHVNGSDRSEELFTAALTAQLKPVVNNSEVRAALVEKMRTAAHGVEARGAKGVVLEGRDIGTVVFPRAELKIFLDASPEVRAERRWKEHEEKGEELALREVLNEVHERDLRDRERKVSPLVRAQDAVLVDNTAMGIEETARLIVLLAAEREKELTSGAGRQS